MKRIVHKSRTFLEADEYDRRQCLAMTPAERMRIAHALRSRVFPPPNKDVREWHRRR